MSSTVKQAVSELSVPVPWGEIRGKVWGPDHGRPVLCLHGWADNCGTFSTLIPLLPRECRYVAVDFPGHGQSSHRPPGVFYAFPAYVADVRRVVEALQWTKFSIIGHSMGDALYPEMVDVVVLLDAFGFVPTAPKEIFKVMRQGMDELLQFEQKAEQTQRVYTYEKAVERLLAANPTLSLQSVHILLERGLAQVEGASLNVNFILCFQKNIARTTLEQCLEMQKKIQARFLVILINSDVFLIQCVSLPLSLSLSLRQHTVVTVPGDHHVHLNNPEVVAPLVSDFLQRTHTFSFTEQFISSGYVTV
uniref:AB hydrolase-1 domain-containing protein n=1 Tax=Anabas testudineus TaxID=64144 RepID=A0A3Q1GX84_ANATE